MKKHLFLAFLIALFTGAAMATEEPEYSVIEQQKEFELRAYKPMIIAETTVAGSFDSASKAGFKIIADYIFGNNRSVQGNNKKVKMTAPVTMQKNEGLWQMHFVMPKEHTIENLPTPNNSAVKLRERPSQHYAVIRFSGLAGETKISKKTSALIKWLEDKGMRSIGTPEIARYNPPWTLPFFRRNEIMVQYHPVEKINFKH